MKSCRLTCLALLASLGLVACHHVSGGYDVFGTEGLRYRAGSALVGAKQDTLRIAVVVANDSRNPRLIIESSMCSPFNRVIARLTAGSHEWQSEVWKPAKQPPPFSDTLGVPRLYACNFTAQGVSSGGSTTYVLLVPVNEVLGDSLPSRRYRVTVGVRVNAKLVHGLDAGEVYLRSPNARRSALEP